MKSIPNPISLINEENLEIIYVETDGGTKRYAREKGSVGTFKRYKTQKEIEWEWEFLKRKQEAETKALDDLIELHKSFELEEEKPKRYGYPKKKKKGWFS